MTREMTFAEMNKQINPMVPHGRAYYMAGATAPVAASTITTAQQVFAGHAQLIKEMPDVRAMIGYELFHLAHVNQVPNDAMAFACRGPQMNVMLNFSWDPSAEVSLKDVRKRAKERVRIVQGEGPQSEAPYGNYGKLVLSLEPSYSV